MSRWHSLWRSVLNRWIAESLTRERLLETLLCGSASPETPAGRRKHHQQERRRFRDGDICTDARSAARDFFKENKDVEVVTQSRRRAKHSDKIQYKRRSNILPQPRRRRCPSTTAATIIPSAPGSGTAGEISLRVEPPAGSGRSWQLKCCRKRRGVSLARSYRALCSLSPAALWRGVFCSG